MTLLISRVWSSSAVVFGRLWSLLVVFGRFWSFSVFKQLSRSFGVNFSVRVSGSHSASWPLNGARHWCIHSVAASE
jgi:hypothetical protein